MWKYLFQQTSERMKRTSSNTIKSKPPSKSGHWSAGLLESMKNPELQVREDESVVVIKDKYPKARFHFLVIPKENIHSITHVTKDNLELLKHMDEVGREVAEQHKPHEFLVGYHRVPSMQRLHLHVISTDFDNPCLKTKYHWNSFNTPFFHPSEDVIKELEEFGTIKKIRKEDSDKLLKSDLKCHRCSMIPKNMPDLKRHLMKHISISEN